MKSVALVGGFDATYPRTDVIISGLKFQGYDLKYLHVPWSSPFIRTRRLKKLLAKTREESDVMFVPSFCHHEVPVVRRWTSKPIIFDPLISRYLTKVHDLKKVSPLSVHAWINRRIDKLSMRLADVVLADTESHKKYFSQEFGIDESKIKVVPVGYNSEDFYPLEKQTGSEDVLTVGFYGSFLPLHGIEHIIEAASILKDQKSIRFELVGSGYTFKETQARAHYLGLNNVTFTGKKNYAELNACINSWDICLGVFGSTLKASLVIPNKVYHYAGCKKPIISMDSPAIRELFTPGENIVLSESDPKQIAECILDLFDDKGKRERIAAGAYAVAQSCTHSSIGLRMREIIEAC